jgi:hypothetical protein
MTLLGLYVDAFRAVDFQPLGLKNDRKGGWGFWGLKFKI